MILFLVACLTPVERGTVTVCMDGARTGEDQNLDLAGTITAVGTGDCATEVTLTADDGTEHVLGWTVVDGDGADLAPQVPLEVGTAVTAHYAYRLVWGDVAGFSLADESGLLLAMDEGTWGDALTDSADSLGFSVSYGELLGSEATDCQPVEGHALEFEADDTVAVDPIGDAPITIGGATYTGLAVAAWKWGESSNCQIMDATDQLAWVVSRP